MLANCNINAQISSLKDLASDPLFHQEIQDLWKELKPEIEKLLENSDKHPYNLYNTQIQTHSLMKYAFNTSNIKLIDDLLKTYSISLSKMKYTDQYIFYYFESGSYTSQRTLDQKYKMWVTGVNNNEPPGIEGIIQSSQFLALISEAVLEISKIKPYERTETMIDFTKNFIPILDSHYKRWVVGIEVEGVKDVGPFGSIGWGCKKDGKLTSSLLTQIERINLLKTNAIGDNFSYCNAVTDQELWIISGVSNYLAASQIDSELIKKPKYFIVLKKFLSDANSLLASRLTTSNLLDFEDQPVEGLNFDLGAWSDYSDYDYAGYTGASYPTESDKSTPKNVGWDISHARRFIFVFESLYKNKEVLGFSFPNDDVMTKLANQFVYGVFNKDFTYPLFSNYMDGSNGWYRVGYAGRNGFGYAPHSITESVLSGGFGFYQKYQPQTDLIMASLYNTIHSKEPAIINFVKDKYEHLFWMNHKPVHSYNFSVPNKGTKFILLEFYASIGSIDMSGENLDDVQVYPVPAKDDEINIKIPSKLSVKQIKIYDVLGKLIYNKNLIPKERLVTLKLNLARGIYFVNAITDDTEFNKKIIVK